MVQAKNAEEFMAKARQAIASNPDCGTSHYNLAVALMGQKRFEEAEESLHMAVNCSPTLAEAYVLLGGISLQRGDLEGCLKYNKNAINARAGFAEGHGNIGFVYLQMGKLEDAIHHLEKAVRWNIRFIQAYANLANAYLMNGQLEESLQTNLKLLELEPNFAVAHNNLAILYLEKGVYDLAAEHCAKAKELGYQVAEEIESEIKRNLEK
jgi:tetratricopeptide (TPR) repeat protein